MIFILDFFTRENHCQITSLVTKESLFTVTHALFYSSFVLCMSHHWFMKWFVAWGGAKPLPEQSNPKAHVNYISYILLEFQISPYRKMYLKLLSNLFMPPMTVWYTTTWNWINIGSSNGLVPDGVNPLAQPVLTYHWWGLATLNCKQFHGKCSGYQSVT